MNQPPPPPPASGPSGPAAAPHPGGPPVGYPAGPGAPAGGYRRTRMPVLVPHLAWEFLLLLLVGVVGVVAALRVPLFHGGLLAGQVGSIGLLAAAVALSLRTGAPNLAVGGIAGMVAVWYASLVNEAGVAPAVAAVAMLVASLGFGLLLGVVAGLLSAPGWAVTLGTLMLAQATMWMATDSLAPVPTEVILTGWGWWLALFLFVSLAGAVVCALPPVRDRLAAVRAGEVRFRLSRLLWTGVGLAGSSLLAGLAGLAMTARARAALPDDSLQLLFLALGAALIGGVSVYGGRGGIAGTVLGTVLVAEIATWLAMEDLGYTGQWLRLLLIGVVILIGLIFSRVAEAIAPLAAPEPASGTPRPATPVPAPRLPYPGPQPGAAPPPGPPPASPPGAPPPVPPGSPSPSTPAPSDAEPR